MHFDFFEALGWFGNILISIGVIPQVIKTWRTHDTSSFDWAFLLMWAFGVLFAYIYVVSQNFTSGKFQFPLWLTYIVDLLASFYLIFAKWRYGKSKV